MVYEKMMSLGKYQPSLEISTFLNKSLGISGSLHFEQSRSLELL